MEHSHSMTLKLFFGRVGGVECFEYFSHQVMKHNTLDKEGL